MLFVNRTVLLSSAPSCNKFSILVLPLSFPCYTSPSPGSPCYPFPPPPCLPPSCPLLPFPTWYDCNGVLGLQAELDAMNGGGELEVLAKSEPEEEEGATMMGRKARELMLSGQGDAALQDFKV